MKFPLIATIFAVPNWTDKLGLAFTGVLAVVGIVGIIVAICTLKIIERQTKATETAANAAKASADALINIERAWVMLDLPFKPEAFWHHARHGRPKVLSIIVTLKNFGKTPAWISESSVRFVKCLPGWAHQELEYAEPSKIPKGEPVPPGKLYSFSEVELEPIELLSDSDYEQIGGGQSILLLFGYVKYRDVFFDNTKQVRETYFCLRYRITTVEYMTDKEGRWVYEGPPEANRHS